MTHVRTGVTQIGGWGGAGSGARTSQATGSSARARGTHCPGASPGPAASAAYAAAHAASHSRCTVAIHLSASAACSPSSGRSTRVMCVTHVTPRSMRILVSLTARSLFVVHMICDTCA